MRLGKMTMSCALLALTLGGCAREGAKPDAAVSAGDPRGLRAAQPVGEVSPPNEYRRRMTEQAMRGLRYESGRVEIDAVAASEIAAGPDAVQAEQAAQRAADLLRHNEVIDALAGATRAVLLDPQNAERYESLGDVLIAKRMDGEAVAAFGTALALEPARVSARFKLGDALNRTGQLEAAIETLQEVIAQAPDHAAAHARLAVLTYYAEDRAAAEAYAQRAAALGQPVPPQLTALLDGTMPVAAMARGGAPVPQIGAPLRVNLDSGGLPGNETSIAVSEANPAEIVGSWNDYRLFTARCGVALSLDGGETYNDFVVRPPAPFQTTTEGDPMTAFDNRTGTLWVGAISFGSNGGVFVARKDPGEAAFAPAVMARVTNSADKGWMAAGPDPNNAELTRLYIAYNQGLLISTDMGATWSGPVFLDSGLGFLPRIGPGGELYIAYWDIGNGVTLIRSFDGGQTLSAPIQIATRMDVWGIDDTRVPGDYRVAILHHLAVDPNDGTLYCVFFDTTNIVLGSRNLDLYFTRSTNQGTTWTTPVIINTDNSPPGDQFFPWIEVDQSGRLHLLFYDTRAVAQHDDDPEGFIEARYAWSDDGGDTWSEALLTPGPFSSAADGFGGIFIGDYLGMAVAGRRAFPLYLDTREGTGNIYVHRIVAPLVGDLDGDGDVDLNDFATLAVCVGGAGVMTPPAGCSAAEFAAADLDGDGDVDLGDFATFSVNFGG